MLRSRLIGYIWDPVIPVDTIVHQPEDGPVSFVVARSGPQRPGPVVDRAARRGRRLPADLRRAGAEAGRRGPVDRHQRHPGQRRRALRPDRVPAALMDRAFPIVRHPAPDRRTPVLVSVPHYGTQPLPDITRDRLRRAAGSRPSRTASPNLRERALRRPARARRHRAGHARLAHVRGRQPTARRLRAARRRGALAPRGGAHAHDARGGHLRRGRSGWPSSRSACGRCTTRTTRRWSDCSASSHQPTATRCCSTATPAARGG